jgi:murein endopeptidase/tRNA A-37 threonylcarbamoyl transferase component Bud32
MEYDARSRDDSVEHDDDTGRTLLGVRPTPAQDRLELPVARAVLRRRMFGEGELVRIGRFELGRRLGGGAMGVVFSAYDPNLAREIAIKLLHPEVGEGDVERTRLLREAQALARLSHPNVVHVYDAGTHDGAVFVAMELVAGRTLRAWQIETRPAWRDIVRVYLGAARGLAAAHEAGLVHRDFKPENVIVDDALHARVVDFGLARADEIQPTLPTGDLQALAERLQSRLTEAGAVLGTPAYMAPEQLAGEAVDAASDQFAFCVALWEALYGARPYSVHAIAAYLARRDVVPRPTAPASSAPPALAAALRRGLQLDRTQRYASMTDLAAALERACRAPWRTRAAAIVVGVLAASGIAALALEPSEDEAPAPVRVATPEPPTEDVVTRDEPDILHDGGPIVHRVSPFEDLPAIAQRYGVSEASLRAWNDLPPDAPLPAELSVHEPVRRPLPWQVLEYTVKEGETDRAALAERFHVAPDRVRAPGDALEVGTTIEVWVDPKPYPRPTSRATIDPPIPRSHASQSIGSPTGGSLRAGVQLPDSDAYVRRSPMLLWGSAHAVASFQRAVASFRREVDWPGVLVLGEMSVRAGGRLAPHRSHQSGREIDIWLPSLPGVFEPAHLERSGRRPLFSEIDWHATWGLVKALVTTGAVRDIFLDWIYQEHVYRAAVAAGATDAELQWIQWPRSRDSLEGMIIHSADHLSHMHVRFECARWETACEDERYRRSDD